MADPIETGIMGTPDGPQGEPDSFPDWDRIFSPTRTLYRRMRALQKVYQESAEQDSDDQSPVVSEFISDIIDLNTFLSSAGSLVEQFPFLRRLHQGCLGMTEGNRRWPSFWFSLRIVPDSEEKKSEGVPDWLSEEGDSRIEMILSRGQISVKRRQEGQYRSPKLELMRDALEEDPELAIQLGHAIIDSYLMPYLGPGVPGRSPLEIKPRQSDKGRTELDRETMKGFAKQ